MCMTHAFNQEWTPNQVLFHLLINIWEKKNPDNNLRQEAGLFSLFSAVEYFQACPFFGFALGFWEMFLKGIS